MLLYYESPINLAFTFDNVFLYNLSNSQLLYLWTLTGGKKKRRRRRNGLKKVSAQKTDKYAAKDYGDMQWLC